MNIVPGLRRHFFQLADHPATVVNLYLFIAGLAVQHILIEALNAQFADIVGCGIVRQLAVFVEALHVFIVDFRHVADNVGQGGTIGVVAALIAFHFHAGKAVLVHGETRHLYFRQVGFHRDGGKTMGAGTLFFERRDVVIRQIHHAAQRVERLLHVIDFFRHHLDLVDGAVEGQRDAVAIVNNAAAGRDRHQLDAVFVGARLVIGEAQDLQIIEIRDQYAGKQ